MSNMYIEHQMSTFEIENTYVFDVRLYCSLQKVSVHYISWFICLHTTSRLTKLPKPKSNWNASYFSEKPGTKIKKHFVTRNALGSLCIKELTRRYFNDNKARKHENSHYDDSFWSPNTMADIF